jgi:phthalate 4,5-cis-dihydrodiol dehydrogenase
MLGVGLIGAGYFGAVHARAIAATQGVALTAVCAEEADQARAFAAQHGGTPYSDWRCLLEDGWVDSVVIATPHHLHCEMAVAAARAGKHVLLEKPMARTVAECTSIIHAAERHGVKLMVGQLMHFALPCMMARQMIERGDCGRPVTGSSTLIKLWMEANRRAWHLDPATGGGMLMTAGIHALDLLVWLMDGRVETVCAAVGASFHRQPADDSAMLLLRFADGRFGQVASVGYVDGAMTYGLDLICERAALRIDFQRGLSIGRGGVWTDVPLSMEAEWMARAVEREWQAMAGIVNGTAANPVTGAHGRHVIACIEAALLSGRERREVQVAS